MPSDAPGLSGPTSHVYFSQRLRLHYVDWGNNDAPPLLLVHGGRDHCRSWDWVAQRLRDRYHVIAPDLRGHGDSQWVIGSGYAINDYVYDVAQLVHQQSLEPVTIIAHSWGGAVSLRYAGLYPDKVRKIVAIEGLGPLWRRNKDRKPREVHEQLQEWIDVVRGMAGRLPRRYESIDAAIARMRKANPRLSPEQARHLTIHGMNQNEDGTYTWKFDNYERIWMPDPAAAEIARALWRRITAPTLLIHGAESPTSDPMEEGLLEEFPDARLWTVPEAGHWVHHDQLDLFVRTVRDFFDE